MESATKTQAKNKYQVSIDLLNDAVGKEIATSLQYMYFHTHFEDDRYQYLSKIMREISIAEMRHIEEFSNEASRIASENKDAVTHKMFQDIIVEEEQHLDTFRTELQNLIDYGEEYLALQSAAGSKHTSKSFNHSGGGE